MRKILITGSTGQLGQEIKKLSKAQTGISFVFTDRSQIDLTRPDSLNYILQSKPDILVHCAAYTAVDRAEEEPQLARQVNGMIMEQIGQICQDLDIPVIYFSSDYVYHNYLRRPLTENDPTRPKGHYAKSKLLGEKLLQRNHAYPLIFRVSWLYSTFGHNFPKTMLRLGREREQLTIVDDQVGAPTYARDVARMVLQLIDRYQGTEQWKEVAGIYNYCNTGQTHWAGIAEHIMQRSALSCKIVPIPSVKYPTPAPRPRYSVLNLVKFKRNFQLPIRPWQDALDNCLEELLNER